MNKFIVNRKKKVKIRYPRLTPGVGLGASHSYASLFDILLQNKVRKKKIGPHKSLPHVLSLKE